MFNSIRTKIIVIVLAFMAVIDASYVLYSTKTTANYKRLRTEIFQKTIDIEAEKINKIIAENDAAEDDIIQKLLSIKPTQNSSVILYAPDKDQIFSDEYSPNYGNFSFSYTDFTFSMNPDFTYNNQKYKRFVHFMDNGWLLFVQIPENEMFTQVTRQNIIFSTIMEISFVLLLVLVFFIISIFINAPIKSLTQNVSQIALGNLDMKIDINSKDEIGQLAKTFNKMTSDLKKSIDENVHEREEKKRITTELSIAREIQLNFLKNDFFEFHQRDEFDIFADMAAAKEVGGDLYDFFLIDNDNLAVVIADVSGKGIPASLFMVRTKTLINNISYNKNPKEVLEAVNKNLCENNEACIFVTAIFGVYNVKTGKFAFVNAGHNPPLLKKKDGFFEYINTKPQIVLAVMKDTEYKEEEIILGKGDTLYFYTDGVTEAMNSEKELFGEDRLKDALNKYRSSYPNDLIYNIKNEVNNFTEGAEQSDDIAMLALRINEDNQTEKQITVDAEIKQLNRVLNFITAELKKTDYEPEIQNKIEMASEEIFTNIAGYAYADEGGKVKIAVSVIDGIKITFEDNGKPFNPAEHPDPDLEKPIKDREIGGLGLFLVKQVMDEVEYTRENDKNILKILKK
ncbi:MAG: SpoIIE family protein phosphatase [Treponema sp.]|nr:SpoIIE family protein phosphatase [Treponema sp.]